MKTVKRCNRTSVPMNRNVGLCALYVNCQMMERWARLDCKNVHSLGPVATEEFDRCCPRASRALLCMCCSVTLNMSDLM